MSFFARFFCVVLLATFALYSYIQKQNELTQLRMTVPQLQKRLKLAQDDITRLQLECEQFHHPLNLMALSHKPEFGHLKHPLASEIIHLPSPEEPTTP